MKTRFNLVACVATILAIMFCFGFVSCKDNAEPKINYVTVDGSDKVIDSIEKVLKFTTSEPVFWGITAANNNDSDKNNDMDSSDKIVILDSTETSCTVGLKDGFISSNAKARLYATLKADTYRYGFVDIIISLNTNIVLNSSNGSFIFDTIQAALDSIKDDGDYEIILQKGTYNENYINYNGPATIKIKGDTDAKYGADVIITGHGTSMGQERGRELLEFQGSGNLILENLTLLSDYSRETVKGDAQAEVLGYDGTGYVAAYNCGFKSHQDTMRTTGKCWFYKCYVEGDTDFIWMESAGIVALYEECEIVSVYDEFASTHASYVLAPRATVGNTMGKGAVIYNSTLELKEGQETFLFRNPWGNNKDYYNQGAFVNVTVTGNGTMNADLAKSDAMGTTDQKYVGWKIDEDLAEAYGARKSSIGVIDADLEAKEYSGRRAILNRNYSVKFAKFLKDSESYFDVDAVIAEQGWTVTEDTSKTLLDGEVETEVVTYVLDTESIDGLTCSGFALETGKTHYAGKNGSTISFDVKGPCTVSVTGYYQGVGKITAGTQGPAIYNCTNGSTSKFITKDYVVYQEGTSTVTIAAEGTSYLTKIAIAYDKDIKFNPVTDIAISTADNAVEISGKKSLQFSAVVTPSNASNVDFVWTCTAGATIDASGLLTADNVETETIVTVTAKALDENGFTATKDITVIPASANAVDLTWLDNTESNLAGVSSNAEIATAGNAVVPTTGKNIAEAEITAEWKYNKTKLDGEGITLKVADDNPLPGEWYIEYPVTAVVPMRIDTLKINWGNCGTSNLRTYVEYIKNDEEPVVIFDEKLDKALSSPRTSDNPSMTFTINGVLAAGDTGKVRVSVHGIREVANEDGSVTENIQTIDGKSPTWGKTVISATAGNFPIVGQTYEYNLCSKDNLKAAGSTADEMFSWTGANPGSGHGLQAGEGILKVAGNVKITVGLCKYGSGTISVKNGDVAVADLTVVKMTACCAKGVTPSFTADNSQSFEYKGDATELSFTWSSNVYLEGIKVEPLE